MNPKILLLSLIAIIAIFASVACSDGGSTSGPASIQITSPTSNSTENSTDVEIKLKVSGFKLDGTNINLGNKAGVGHLVVLLDGAQVTRTAKTSIKVTGLSADSHAIVASLNNNDLSALSPPVESRVTFTYQVPANPGKSDSDAIPVPPTPRPTPTPTFTPTATPTPPPTPEPTRAGIPFPPGALPTIGAH